jgi:hypothetical protein
LLDRPLERLRQREVERSQQVEGAQQLDQRDALHRLASLEALQGRATDPGLLGQLILRQISRQPLALKPTAELGEHGVVRLKIIKHHL